MYVEVAVELPVEGTFSYSVPDALTAEAGFGKRVVVPFARRTVTGHILAVSQGPPPPPPRQPADKPFKLRAIIDVLDPVPIFDAKRLKFLKLLAAYYFAPLGMVLSLQCPAGSGVKSNRYFTATAEGRGSGETGFGGEVIEAAGKGVTLLALLKRFRARPVYSTVARLKARGLITEEVRLSGARGHKLVRYVEAGPGASDDPPGRMGPLQRKVYDTVYSGGRTTVSALREALGGVDDAVKRLAARGLLTVSEGRVLRDPLSGVTPKASDHEPNEEQARAIAEITGALKTGGYSPFLLYGVTGSGKTLVYLKVLEEVIASGKKAVFMVPEIALTPWPAAYLVEKFPGMVALAHSGLSSGERYDEWMRALAGEADVVVGARSALFAPLKDIGVIIVDEEHETSYKQEEGVRYHGRDAALMYAKVLGIPVVLGSATPSLETFHNAQAGRLKLLTLSKRVSGGELPATELVDMKAYKRRARSGGGRGPKGADGGVDGAKVDEAAPSPGVLSPRLAEELGQTLAAGQQAMLFLNRRGFASFLICADCGHTFSCLNCSVTLTLHKRGRSLLCHYCDYSQSAPDECPECRGLDLVEPAAGTEKLEEEVRERFPEARVVRMDRDTTRRKGTTRDIISAVESGQADVLVGTQMVSKGHHFPGITLVGIISGDTSLNFPDFRSAERTLQLITQAAGRAGRGAEPGRVVIQTLNPEHYAFQCAAGHDYETFYTTELSHREEVVYPPFTRLCSFRIEAVGETRAAGAAEALRELADGLKRRHATGVTVLGPAPALITRIRGRFRWQLLLKGQELKELHSFASTLKRGFEARGLKGVTLFVDMDPLNVV